MAAVNAVEIELAFEAAAKLAREENDGKLDAVTEMALRCMVSHLLDSLISEQTKFKETAEWRVVEAEKIQDRICGSGS